VCSDCGSNPSHEDAPCGYCRGCAEKGGHRTAFYVRIDRDEARRVLGRELADRLFALDED
jgi:hypothetical protein